MTKQELAEYLVNLNSLMEAQEKATRPKSRWLIEEYNKRWQEFQEAVMEDTE